MKPVQDLKIGIQPSKTKSIPIVWTIAGSDSGGGAGIQVDLKAMNAFGVHGCSAITAITAQNTQGVIASEPVSPKMVESQLQALTNDLPPRAIKSGMLGSADCCRILAENIPANILFICDPVLKSTSGSDLLAPDALDVLKIDIFPRVTVLTPNLPETEKLVGPFSAPEEAAEKLLLMGIHSVLIKGGHSETGACRDYWTNGNESMWLTSPRIETRHSHGTGCILSSAIAASIALGQTIPEAIISGKTFMNQCLKAPANMGSGHGPMIIRPFENRPEDRPSVN